MENFTSAKVKLTQEKNETHSSVREPYLKKQPSTSPR